MREETPEIIAVRDPEAGLEGWVAIDRTVRGRAGGGLRVTPWVNAEELALLARTMTMKYGFLGIPKGGAKAGIRFDGEKDPEKALDLLARFGRAIRPLIESRRYVPGPDMGTDEERIRHLLRSCGCLGGEGEAWRWAESGRYTAAGVVGAFREAYRTAGGDGRPTAVIEGYGAVGGNAAHMLVRSGVPVVAIATRHGAVHNGAGIDLEEWETFLRGGGPSELREFRGAETIGREDFLRLPVAAFLPCAIAHTIRTADAAIVGARMIVPGANNPIEPGAGEILESRGTIVLPDFVTNTGGILGGALEHGGLSPDEAARRVREAIGGAVSALLDQASRSGLTPTALAERTVLARFERVAGAHSSPLLLFGLALRRRGLLPRVVSRFLASAQGDRIARRARRFET
ncbi:MAG: Glu/Leu/Phe/Val dehydrogenase dimerization domain-containing protein [Candidatus Eisenbacteria bacterium]